MPETKKEEKVVEKELKNDAESNGEMINKLNDKKTKTKSIIIKFFNSIGFIILLGILLFLKTMFFYSNTIAISETLEIETIIGTLFFLIIIVCAICILPNRARIITGIIVSMLISIILFGDNIYYTYSNSVLSVAQITNLQYGEEIMASLPMVLEFKQILYFLDIVIILILLASKILKIDKNQKKQKNN